MTSVAAAAHAMAAVVNDLDMFLRRRLRESRCCMGKKLPCYRRDASVSCS
jgi:hypothetical protein